MLQQAQKRNIESAFETVARLIAGDNPIPDGLAADLKRIVPRLQFARRGGTGRAVIAGEMTANAAARAADWRSLVSVGIVAIPTGIVPSPILPAR